jgi:lysozyme
MKRRNVTIAALAICVPLCTGFEGVRHTVYRDVVGVPTYCIGETKNPQWGHVYSDSECASIFEGRLKEFADGVERCVTVDMPAKREAAMIDFAYNLGIAGFCRSSVARNLNAGNTQAACDALLQYDRAGRKVFPGLERRRQQERKLCLED